MRRAPRHALALSMFLLAACVSVPQAGASSSKQTPIDAGQVQAFVRSFADAANRGDTKKLSKMFSHEHGVSSINDGEIAEGWDAIRKNNDFLSVKEGAYRFDLQSIEVTPLGNTHALAVAPLKLTVSGSEESVELSSIMTLVLERTGSSWLIVHEHLSSEDDGDDDDLGPDETPSD